MQAGPLVGFQHMYNVVDHIMLSCDWHPLQVQASINLSIIICHISKMTQADPWYFATFR